MTKKIAALILCLFIVTKGPTAFYSNVSADAAMAAKKNEAQVLDGFLEEDGAYHYYENGEMAAGRWVTSDDDKYYFDEDGKMAVGIVWMDKKFYCFRANGKYNAEKTAKIRKAAKYEKPFAKLKKLIGNPNKTKYYASCYGNGKDGVLSYHGFTIYTFKPAKGKEIFMNVE